MSEITYFLDQGFGIEPGTVNADDYYLESFFEILGVDNKSKEIKKNLKGELLVPIPQNIPFGTLGTALTKASRYSGTLSQLEEQLYVVFQGGLTSIPEEEFRKLDVKRLEGLEKVYEKILDGKYRDLTPTEIRVKHSLNALRLAYSWKKKLQYKERQIIIKYDACKTEWNFDKFDAFLKHLNIKMKDSGDSYYIFRQLLCGAKATGYWGKSMRLLTPENSTHGLKWKRTEYHWKSFDSLKNKGIMVQEGDKDKDKWVISPFIKNQSKTFKFTPKPKEDE